MKALLSAALLFSCSTIAPLDVQTIYKKEMKLKANGVDVVGTGVVDFQPQILLEIETPSKPNVLKITSCHREEVFRDVGKKLQYVYKAMPGIEDTGYCLIEIASFDEEGSNTMALIDLRQGERLRGYVGCNGQLYLQQGVAMCQSRANLLQTIIFEKEVCVQASADCVQPVTKDNKTFTIPLSRTKCVYLFSADDNIFRLTTFGYDEVTL